MFIDEVYINYLLGFFSALLLFSAIFWWFFQRWELESRAMLQALEAKKKALHKSHLLIVGYEERIKILKDNQETQKRDFSHIAQQILQENQKSLSMENRAYMGDILEPFQAHVKAFHDRVEAYYSDESKERYSLTKEIQNLQKLNHKISEDAQNLTQALKGDNKVQGNWGELILERVLENSGLKKGREYVVQKSYHDDQGLLYRPDVVVQLPDAKQVIIDSKVSLKSYEAYYHDSMEKEEAKKAFILSLRRHIDGLSKKSYEQLEGINSLDFVLLFIPIEGAFMLAQSLGENLYEEAYAKNIILVSPSTLLAVLRVIEHAWRIEYQNKNAKIIAKKAGDLYSKFENFIIQMQKIDSSLDKARLAYDDAFKKLSTGKGNLMNRAQELRELEGVVHNKRDRALD